LAFAAAAAGAADSHIATKAVSAAARSPRATAELSWPKFTGLVELRCPRAEGVEIAIPIVDLLNVGQITHRVSLPLSEKMSDYGFDLINALTVSYTH
jgi:hypothetical protein